MRLNETRTYQGGLKSKVNVTIDNKLNISLSKNYPSSERMTISVQELEELLALVNEVKAKEERFRIFNGN